MHTTNWTCSLWRLRCDQHNTVGWHVACHMHGAANHALIRACGSENYAGGILLNGCSYAWYVRMRLRIVLVSGCCPLFDSYLQMPVC